MRRRLFLSMSALGLLIVVLLGVPLGIAGSRLIRDEATRRLQHEADLAALALSGTPRAGTYNGLLASVVHPPDHIVATTSDGTVLLSAGAPPHGSRLSAQAVTDTGVTVSVDAPAAPVGRRVEHTWLAVAAVSIATMAIASIGSARLSRALARPLSGLALMADRLGNGDLTAAVPRSGIDEIDAVAQRLAAGANALAELRERDIQFVTNSSHQLRTAITALRIPVDELGAVADPKEIALLVPLIVQRTDRLETTVSELLDLARGVENTVAPVDLAAVVQSRLEVWRPVLARQDRAIALDGDPDVACAGSAGAIGQILDVVLDNTDRYGRGPVNIEVEHDDDRVLVNIADHGPGVPAGYEARIFDRGVSLHSGRGIGLAVACDLARACGGSLTLTRARPARFTLALRRIGAATMTDGQPVADRGATIT